MRMNFQRKLPIPQEVKQECPLTERIAEDIGWEKTEQLIFDIADKL